MTVRANVLQDAHFGVHITNSSDDVIENNTIDVGADAPVERRGHAVYFWEVAGSTLYGNTIRHAADGIHLEYANATTSAHNTVTQSRYACTSCTSTTPR